MKKDLTKRQQEVLNYIKKYIATHGFPPSTREIGSALNLSSPATVHTHLNNLIKAGYIKKTNSKFRTIEIIGENEFSKERSNTIKVPLLGNIACGNPIEAIENPNEWINLPAEIINNKKEIFTLKASGDSMIKKGIFNGDIVIIERKANAQNGDIVVAMTEDNDVTLKTFYKEKESIRLQPENDSYSPIILKNCTILGKAIGLFRKI